MGALVKEGIELRRSGRANAETPSDISGFKIACKARSIKPDESSYICPHVLTNRAS